MAVIVSLGGFWGFFNSQYACFCSSKVTPLKLFIHAQMFQAAQNNAQTYQSCTETNTLISFKPYGKISA